MTATRVVISEKTNHARVIVYLRNTSSPEFYSGVTLDLLHLGSNQIP